MGYTHYWSVKRSHPTYASLWPLIIDDTWRIIASVRAIGIVIAGPDGYRRPILDPVEGITFNGDATTDLDYETFTIAPPTSEPGFASTICKTERRPYDLAVASVLLRCAVLLPDVFLIASDGRWDDEWDHGVLPTLPGAGYAIGARRLISDLFGDEPATSPFHSGRMPAHPGWNR